MAIALTAVLCSTITTVHADTGSLEGTITYEGKAPRMRPLPVESDPHCAALHEGKEPIVADWLVLGEGQTVANVFVQIIEGLPDDAEYPIPEVPAELSQQGCQYNPHVLAVRAGQPIRFLNPDGITHNIHLLPKVNSERNLSMTQSLAELTHTFKKAEPVFRIKCDVHNWMEAYCVVLDHPYFDVTEPDGRFRIENLPVGEYTLEVWHEKLGTYRREVVVESDTATVVDFTLSRPQRK